MPKWKTAPQKRLFRCAVCGEIAPATKRRGKTTQPGHVKHMYCLRCKVVTEHVQIE